MHKKLRKIFLLTLLTMIVQHTVSGQMGVFSRQLYNSVGGMRAHDVLSLKDSGFLIAGTANNYGLILNLDTAGVQRWGLTYSRGANSSTVFDQVTRNSKENFFVAGEVSSWLAPSSQAFVGCLTPSGDSLWWRTLAFDSAYINIADMATTLDDGVIVVGTMTRSWSTDQHSFVTQFDSTGAIVWSGEYSVFGLPLTFASVKTLNDGTYFISGQIGNVTNGALLMRLSATGQTLFSKTYGLFSGGGGTMIGADELNGKWLGLMEAYGTGSVLMRLDTFGVALSAVSSIFDAGSFEYQASPPPFICDSLQGCFWMGGTCGGSQLLRTDTAGTLLYVQYMEVNVYSATLGLDGGICVIGNGPLCGVRHIGPFDDQIGIIKEDTQGNAASCVSLNIGQLWPQTVTTITASVSRMNGGTTGSIVLTAAPFSPVNVPGCVAWIGGFDELKRMEVRMTYDAQTAVVSLSSERRNMKHIDVLDITGRRLTEHTINATSITIPLVGYSNGMLIVKVLMEDGQLVSQKVMHFQ